MKIVRIEITNYELASTCIKEFISSFKIAPILIFFLISIIFSTLQINKIKNCVQNNSLIKVTETLKSRDPKIEKNDSEVGKPGLVEIPL